MNTDSVDLLVYWINEREAVRRRRWDGAPPPWTEDLILQKYHFCNVRREDDRGTQEIRYVEAKLKPGIKALPAFFTAARLFNKASTLEALWKHGVEGVKALPLPIFHTAYVVTTCGVVMDKVDYVDQVVRAVANTDLHSDTCRATFDGLRTVNGLGSFLAGQVVADLKYSRFYSQAPYDFHTFAVMGPGSKKGLDHIFGGGTTERNFTERLTKLYNVTLGQIPIITNQDLQNCLCEFNKYMRYKFDLKGRRRPYHANPIN